MSLATRILVKVSEAVDRKWGWDKLPSRLALLILIGIRDALREKNLLDTYDGDPPPADPPETASSPSTYLTARTADGAYNNLSSPSMGMARTRFGRNVPPQNAGAETTTLLEPNPRTVSKDLLLRRTFKPAETLNILAAAWIQFQVHDWFTHDKDPDLDRAIKVPLPPGDDWSAEPVMRVPATLVDKTHPVGRWPTRFINNETHWWDASQIYGSNEDSKESIRANQDGKVRIGPDGLIRPGIGMFNHDGWWLGLELMSTLFMLEHNAICDRLRAVYPGWSDDRLFNKARLINAALIVKIHTIEWTPAILGHPTIQIGSQANWYGLAGKRVRRLFGRLSSGDLISGIPGSQTAFYGVPYSLTEEFVAVYRMHPLMPDTYTFYDLGGSEPAEVQFEAIHRVERSRAMLENVGVANALYSLGVAKPGAITLRNSPRFMNHFTLLEPGTIVDLNAVDILRQRERGIPRYNDFRRLLRLRPAETFAEISAGDADIAEQLEAIYGDVERVDTIVGMYGEHLPVKFAFSDTAFRIFAVMAARRLECDRFYTVDFTPRMYTPEGMAWIDDNDMIAVLQRHYPELEPVLRNLPNAFAPWPKIG